jgi:hypothetical protein
MASRSAPNAIFSLALFDVPKTREAIGFAAPYDEGKQADMV